jgi:hypothetical protein
MHCKTEDRSLDDILKPPIIDFGDGVARAEDNIDAVFPRMGLAEPAWISGLRVVPNSRKDLQNALAIPGSYEFAAPRTTFLSTAGHGIDCCSGALLGFLFRYAMFEVTFFNMTGLSFLLLRICGFIPS